jgi:3'(2'), 5'-bisphosphate nucleotidase
MSAPPLTVPTRLLRCPPAFAEYRAALELVADATLWSMRFCDLLTGTQEGTSAKADATPVTAADMALQAVLADGLQAAYGAIPVVGEESTAVFAPSESERGGGSGGVALRTRVEDLARLARPALSGRLLDEAIDRGCGDGMSREQWIIDPIDGTRGYLRGQQYCVCLALVRDGVPVFGVAGCPRLGERGWMIAAVRGGGAALWRLDDLGGTPRTPRAGEPDRGTLVACESPGATDRARARLRRMGELVGGPMIVRPMESQCKFVLVATGEADLAIRLASYDPARNRDMVWDYAGAVVFAEESGARMTDCDGNPLRFGAGRLIDRNRGILCAPNWLHDRAVDACRVVDVEFDVPPGPRGPLTEPRQPRAVGGGAGG